MSNRLQRRAAAKRKGNTSEMAKAIYNVEKQAGANATKHATKLYSLAVATVLKDKLHYGGPKIRTTMNQILQVFVAINEGELDAKKLETDLEDIIKMVEEE